MGNKADGRGGAVRGVRAAAGALALAFLASGCGAFRFQRAWSGYEASAQASGEASGMVGRWKGGWRSEWNGHSGGLRCVMTHTEGDRYLARFYSTYALLFFFTHETEFVVVGKEAGVLAFEGEQDLGRAFGGLYRYTGTVNGDSFRATYTAENDDHGVFELERVD